MAFGVLRENVLATPVATGTHPTATFLKYRHLQDQTRWGVALLDRIQQPDRQTSLDQPSLPGSKSDHSKPMCRSRTDRLPARRKGVQPHVLCRRWQQRNLGQEDSEKQLALTSNPLSMSMCRPTPDSSYHYLQTTLHLGGWAYKQKPCPCGAPGPQYWRTQHQLGWPEAKRRG